MRQYKRAICWENIAGHWEDARFYATPDQMVVQFVETAYPDALDIDMPEAEQVRRLHYCLCGIMKVPGGLQA